MHKEPLSGGGQTDINIDLYSDWVGILRSELMQLGYQVDTTRSDDDMCADYFNVLKRSVEVRPRRVVFSREFSCPAEHQDGLNTLKDLCEKGQDLRPYLSTSIANMDFRDLMLYDWGIHHFHLGTEVDARGFVSRTGPVLFAFVTDDSLYCINVRDHGAWAVKSLVETVHRNWRHLIDGFRIKGALDIEDEPSENEWRALREAGVNVLFKVSDGTIYTSPGGGYTTSKHSADVIRECDRYKVFLRKFQQKVIADHNQIREKAASTGAQLPRSLVFRLCADSQGFKVIEQNTHLCIRPIANGEQINLSISIER